MCMASPRGTVSGNADLPGRTRERAQPAPLLPGEKAENRGKAPGYLPQQRRPLGPDKAAGTARPGLLRGGKGFYVSSVIMLLGPPGTIPRRACCGGCVSWAAYGQARLGRRQGKNWDRARGGCRGEVRSLRQGETGRAQEGNNLGWGKSRCNKRCSFKLRSIEGRGFFLFLPKGSEKGEGDRQVSPFTPSCPRGVPSDSPRGEGAPFLA